MPALQAPPNSRTKPHLHRCRQQPVLARARKFHAAGGEPPPADKDGHDSGQPFGMPEIHIEWPYWVLLVTPWLMFGLSELLARLQVCLMCLPANLPAP